MALKWLAEHQRADGSWSFEHRGSLCGEDCFGPGLFPNCRTGATGMALLAFLGAGHTHLYGEYAERVDRGLTFLVNNISEREYGSGDLRDTVKGNEGLYAQGIATMALCEAYAMTGDNSRLRQAAQEAADFIVRAQDPRGGGWRYQPGQRGDTSVIGWQLMALKSARLANLKVPQDSIQLAANFLKSVQSENGAVYGYTNPRGRPSTTAVGLLCRMYLGWNLRHPALRRGVEILDATGPSPNDMYYNYYATQVLFHWGGKPWEVWNEKMRRRLVDSQRHDGHAVGSWDPNDLHGNTGGRLYMTCLCVMTLEVYYRYLPLYKQVDLQGGISSP
jgi:hypothetical protein